MNAFISVLFVFLIILVSSGVSGGQNSDAEKIKNLLDELSSLKATIAQEQKVQEGIIADEKLLKGQDKAIKSIEAQFNKDVPVYERDVAAVKAERSSFEADKSAFVSKWGCWNPCEFKLPEQQAAYNANVAEMTPLNAHLDRVNAEEKRVEAKYDELKKKSDLLKEGKETLSKATLQWAAKKKASDAKMNELIARYQELTKTYMDLLQRAALSEECKQISYSNNRPVVVGGRVVGMQSGLDFNVLNGVMERAHHCLQKVWDGAK